MASPGTVQPPDSAEARKYNQIRRRVGMSEFLLGLGLLVVLLVTGWTAWLRDLAWQTAAESYAFALFLYVLMLVVVSKAVSLGLDYYGFRVRPQYKLLN